MRTFKLKNILSVTPSILNKVLGDYGITENSEFLDYDLNITQIFNYSAPMTFLLLDAILTQQEKIEFQILLIDQIFNDYQYELSVPYRVYKDIVINRISIMTVYMAHQHIRDLMEYTTNDSFIAIYTNLIYLCCLIHGKGNVKLWQIVTQFAKTKMSFQESNKMETLDFHYRMYEHDVLRIMIDFLSTK